MLSYFSKTKNNEDKKINLFKVINNIDYYIFNIAITINLKTQNVNYNL